MAADTGRIDELQRRVQQDPASIAFAHLADEHRRAGDLQEAVRVCRAGLEHHPTYLLAHVTLGRALMELEQYAEARTELEYVLRAAPDNLAALKSIEELRQRQREPAPPVAPVARTPLKLRPSTEDASPDTHVASAAPPPMAQVAPPPVTQIAPPPVAQVAPPPMAQVVSPPVAQVASPPEAQIAAPPEAVDPVLEELEGWLAALNAARGGRGDSRPDESAPASAKRNPPHE